MSKHRIYEKGSFGWLKIQAKKDKFDNIRDWQNWKRCQNIKNIDVVKKILEENKVEITEIQTFYRFWSKVDIKDNKDECWSWTGCVFNSGYGTFSYNFEPVVAHRVAYKLSKGDVSDNLQVQHLCNNRKCCNPHHLNLGTSSQNSQYMVICGRHNGNSKLTKDQVREIHKLYNEQRELYPNLKQWQITEPITKKFEISKQTIDHIISGRLWKHIYKEFNEQVSLPIFTEDNVREIHRLYNEQKKLHPGLKQWMIIEPIAKKFGISKSHVNRIINGIKCKHIYDEFTKN